MNASNIPIALSLADIGVWLFEGHEEMFVFHLIKAKANRQMREFDFAYQDCLNCLSLKKDCADAYFEQGMCFMLENEKKETEKAFKKCLKLQPDHSNAKKALMKIN
eukprot:TRINITY_DN6145_c0_g1_i9.p1 TRINITY_DN6145_c0_g1~~TRINITY_DN6145_c0_g1_i9.p1  ORF type:complete len:117 (-),score=33.12 TRINITY_DN6145_c0_g1_i9:73-390(-)